jgi:hypothetical protein
MCNTEKTAPQVWGPNLPGFNCAPSQIKTTFYVKFCYHKRQAIMYELADVFKKQEFDAFMLI